MATARYISNKNTFLPEPTGQAIAFIRQPGKFRLFDYVQQINSPATVGIYAKLDPDFPVRVVSDAESLWEDGDDAKENNGNQGKFSWEEFRIFRRQYGYSVGEEALNSAKGWNPKAFFDASVISQAMTNRTYRVVTGMDATGNWSGSTAAANTLNGGFGKWDLGSSDPSSGNYLAIRRTLLESFRRIHLKTNGMVDMSDMRLVVGPGAAIRMSETDEIVGFLKNNEFAMAQVKGNTVANSKWGLPTHYAGFEIVVEDAVRSGVVPKTAGTEDVIDTEKTFIKDDDKAVLVSRPGGLDGNYGAPSFSTIQLYYHKYELSVEAKYDDWHKKYRSRVVDKCQHVFAAIRAGYLITDILT